MSNLEKEILERISERLKWVIIIGSFIITSCVVGVGYQVTVNVAQAENLSATTSVLQTHLEEANRIHSLMIEKWINTDD